MTESMTEDRMILMAKAYDEGKLLSLMVARNRAGDTAREEEDRDQT